MDKCVRRRVIACLVAIALLALPTVAAAAPAQDTAPASTWSPRQFLDELVTWWTGWLDQSPIRSLSARGSHTMDPNGSPSPALGDGGTVLTEGAHTMDPNG